MNAVDISWRTALLGQAVLFLSHVVVLMGALGRPLLSSLQTYATAFVLVGVLYALAMRSITSRIAWSRKPLGQRTFKHWRPRFQFLVGTCALSLLIWAAVWRP